MNCKYKMYTKLNIYMYIIHGMRLYEPSQKKLFTCLIFSRFCVRRTICISLAASLLYCTYTYVVIKVKSK